MDSESTPPESIFETFTDDIITKSKHHPHNPLHPHNSCDPHHSHRTSDTSTSISECTNQCDQIQPYCKRTRFDSGSFTFLTMITPVQGLRGIYTSTNGMVQFVMRRKNQTVTLQWESFEGTIGGSGVNKLTTVQGIANTPPYRMVWPISCTYKGQQMFINLEIDPTQSNTINFIIGSGVTTFGDFFTVIGSSVSWIV